MLSLNQVSLNHYVYWNINSDYFGVVGFWVIIFRIINSDWFYNENVSL